MREPQPHLQVPIIAFVAQPLLWPPCKLEQRPAALSHDCCNELGHNWLEGNAHRGQASRSLDSASMMQQVLWIHMELRPRLRSNLVMSCHSCKQQSWASFTQRLAAPPVTLQRFARPVVQAGKKRKGSPAAPATPALPARQSAAAGSGLWGLVDSRASNSHREAFQCVPLCPIAWLLLWHQR